MSCHIREQTLASTKNVKVQRGFWRNVGHLSRKNGFKRRFIESFWLPSPECVVTAVWVAVSLWRQTLNFIFLMNPILLNLHLLPAWELRVTASGLHLTRSGRSVSPPVVQDGLSDSVFQLLSATVMILLMHFVIKL